MKKKIFAAGFIGILLCLTLLLAGCDDLLGNKKKGGSGASGIGTGNGTVIILNTSSTLGDFIVAGIGTSKGYITTDPIFPSYNHIFSNVPTGVQVYALAIDSSTNDYGPILFILSSSEIKTITYDGSNFY